jgi:phosphoglycerate kinase
MKKSVARLPEREMRGKRALLRVDFNVPLDGERVADDTRIRASLPTIQLLIAAGARVVILSHLGRPKGAPESRYSLRPVAKHLASLISGSVDFCGETVGAAARAAVSSLKDGDVLLLENTRFLAGEEKNDVQLSRELATLGDFYVNDAFGAAHRAHSSTVGVAAFLRPAVAGLLMQKELRYLGSALEKPAPPFVAIVGGAKISGKIDVLNSLLPRVDRILVGGAMACTFLRARGVDTGRSLVEEDRIALASQLLGRFEEKISLPVDAVVAVSPDDASGATTCAVEAIPPARAMLDIGPRTGSLFSGQLAVARTVLWNGPMGVFEKPPFDAGTRTVALALAAATDAGATTIVGGGDSAAAVALLGLGDRMSHVSTGGGASLEFIEGKTLPGVAALEDA